MFSALPAACRPRRWSQANLHLRHLLWVYFGSLCPRHLEALPTAGKDWYLPWILAKFGQGSKRKYLVSLTFGNQQVKLLKPKPVSVGILISILTVFRKAGFPPPVLRSSLVFVLIPWFWKRFEYRFLDGKVFWWHAVAVHQFRELGFHDPSLVLNIQIKMDTMPNW